MENHIEAILDAHKIDFERDATTELRHKPDFLFPSEENYRTAPAGAADLAMLGAKSTCKERWRQVLAEADKIPNKHLLTLEPGITEPQTDQMAQHSLQLVVPRSIQQGYSDRQRSWLWAFSDFIGYVKANAI